MLVKFLFFSALWASSYAQDFGVPLSWRVRASIRHRSRADFCQEFGTNRTREERISIAKAALDLMAPKFDKSNVGTWPSIQRARFLMLCVCSSFTTTSDSGRLAQVRVDLSAPTVLCGID
jgi:hypothetical protein